MEDKIKSMDSRELMIGNYLMHNSEIISITSVSEALIKYSNIFGRSYNVNEFHPISLTEDILIRCGFVESTNDPDNKWLRYNLEGYNISIESDESCGFNVAYLQLGRKSIEVTELHSLQNLIFSLTKEKITLK